MKSPTSNIFSVAVCIDTRDGSGRERLHGVAKFARQSNWKMMLVRDSGVNAAQEVMPLKPDGIIAYIAHSRLLSIAKKMSIPLIDTALTGLKAPMTVSVDDDAVGHLAATHFMESGFKNFGYCGVADIAASENRHNSFLSYLNGLKLYSFSEPIFEGESNLQKLTKWLKKLPKPSGVLVFDDKLGERVLTACKWAKLSVPNDVAILGVGNDELMCEVSWPSLSSISFPVAQLGFEAAEMLDQAMNGENIQNPHRKIQPTGVATRSSTEVIAFDDPLLKSAIALIRKRDGDLMGVKQIAQAVGVSRRTLDRKFKEYLGKTVRFELDKVKIQMAHAMLVDRTKKIADISRRCGFTTPASFSRSFHQHTGSWPSEYRKAMR
ncbi:MAG: DNA-binding transcriptional regulator [Verrucomicrobiota bacterium]